MRRSAAPSVISSANKRPRFCPPFAAPKTELSNPLDTTGSCCNESSTPGATPSSELREALHNVRKAFKPPTLSSPLSPSSSFSTTSTLSSLSSSNSATDTNCTLTSMAISTASSPTLQLSVTPAAQMEVTESDSVSLVTECRPLEPATQETGSSLEEHHERVVTDEAVFNDKDKDDRPSQLTRPGTSLITGKTSFVSPLSNVPGGSRSTKGGGVFKPPAKCKLIGAGGRGVVQGLQGGVVEQKDLQGKSSDPGVVSKYYSVMWCKMSKKKHKTWEGDAVLVVRGRTAVLKDMEGKDIGKGTGYRPSELSGMSEGSTLIVGGKEIEVMDEVSVEDWNSGKCFTSSGAIYMDVTPTHHVAPSNNLTKKGFSAPTKLSSAGEPAVKPTPPIITPLYSPTAPNALVLPRPSPRHQLQHNSAGLPVIDVVVDPRLVSTLRPHQMEGVVFLYECVLGMKDFAGNGVILADEMGLGKTLQCITVLWTLLKQGPYGRKPEVKKAIVITPGSLVKNWEREFRKWLGSERITVFTVSAENRVEDFLRSTIYPVLIISYEMFLRLHETLKAATFDLIICDEGHRLKNIGAKTTAAIFGIPTRRRILLTGTPVQNDLREFYSIVEFCNPGVLGSHGAFRRVYEEPIVQSRQPTATPEERKMGETRANELNRLISLFCLRRTQEINNKYLPPKVESVVFCPMSSLQLSIYRQILSSGMVQACLRRFSDSSPHLVCIGGLKKLCNSPSLIYEAARTAEQRKANRQDQDHQPLYSGVLPLYSSTFDPTGCDTMISGKLKVLDRMLQYLHSCTSEKVVLVSNYTQTLDLFQRLCKDRGYEYLRLDGSTPASKRQPLVDQFNSKHSPKMVFLLSSKAGGVGLNLTGASRLVLYDIDWNPANDMQAMARVWRDGQRRRVHIYRLLTTGTIEEKIYQRQVSKQGLSAVVDNKSSGATQTGSASAQFSLEDLKDLFTFRSDTHCDTHDLLGCDCLDGARPDRFPSDSEVGGTPRRQLNSPKNVTMDELLEWKHYSKPIDMSEITDDLLLQAAMDITFVFQNQTNSQAST